MLTSLKNFFESKTGKAVLGIIAMVVAGVVTAKIIDAKKEQ